VNCRCCNGEAKKNGKFKNVNRIVQRYRCLRCGTTFSDLQPLEGIRTEAGEAARAIGMLCEGMGIRAVSRLTGLDKKTVLRILVSAGEHCASLLDEKIQDVKAKQIQIDEIYSFVNCKPQTLLDRTDEERGEFFTYLSVERDSKLIINWRTSKRNKENTLIFMRDLQRRVPERFQLTSDAFAGYCRGDAAVKQVFGNEIDYATETKVFGRTNQQISRYYNPLVVIGIKRRARIGSPDLSKATTCHAERTNLSVRTFTRRFTRCTIGYSKKLENLRHAVAMFAAHFNFCRVHSAHGMTPAQAAGLTDHAWTVEELLRQP
jgi:transposase-like protein